MGHAGKPCLCFAAAAMLTISSACNTNSPCSCCLCHSCNSQPALQIFSMLCAVVREELEMLRLPYTTWRSAGKALVPIRCRSVHNTSRHSKVCLAPTDLFLKVESARWACRSHCSTQLDDTWNPFDCRNWTWSIPSSEISQSHNGSAPKHLRICIVAEWFSARSSEKERTQCFSWRMLRSELRSRPVQTNQCRQTKQLRHTAT